jgi:HD-GYP domain-containing protein (c-di-GMP phosphodiesterase class II)
MGGAFAIERRAAQLVAQLARHDCATGRHSRRVGELAAAVADQLGWTRSSVRDARVAGLVHDAGKLHTPRAILAKPGALTQAERSVIELHPLRTIDVAADFGIPDDVARAGALHHELPRGGGYPFGLAGDEIPELTHVVSATDVFEALTGIRPYRSPMQAVDAIAHLRGRVDRGELAAAPVDALARLVRG